MLIHDQENDYTLSKGESCWITVGKYSVQIVNDVIEDGFLRVDVYPLGNEMEDPVDQIILNLH